MICKLLCFTASAIEIIIYIWEVVAIRKLRRLKQRGYEKPSESRRRRKAKQYGLLTGGVLILFLVVLAIGVTQVEPRACRDDLVLEGATCVECKDANCQSCMKSGSAKCDTCKPGYSFNDRI